MLYILKWGGVLLNKDTRKYKLDYFSGLMTPWWYELQADEVESYRNIIKNKYGKDELRIFDESVRINETTLRNKRNIKAELKKLLEIGEKEKKVLIYGAGQRGAALGEFLKERTGADIEYILSDDRKKEEFEKDGSAISHLREIVERKEKSIILVAVADEEVRRNLEKCELDYFDVPNYIFPFIKDYVKLLH